MFRLLWIEDQLSFVTKLAPSIVALPGIQLDVLVFGTPDTEDVQALEDIGVRIRPVKARKENPLSCEEAWGAISEYFPPKSQGDIPWITIFDLQLSPVAFKTTLETDAGNKEAAGVDLTRLLVDRTECRNVIWLSQWGKSVADHPEDFVKDEVLGAEYGVKVISFPRTFVLDKKQSELCNLIGKLTEAAVSRIRRQDAVSRVQPSRLRQLFRMFVDGPTSVKHYFGQVGPAELGQRKADIGTFDLVPNNDPPMSFSIWLRAHKEQGQPDLHELQVENTKKFVDGLIRTLGDHLWGLPVRDLVQLVRLTVSKDIQERVDLTQMDSLCSYAGDKIIGPIARGRLKAAIGNAVHNAVAAAKEVEDGKVWIECKPSDDGNALDLLVLNHANTGKARQSLSQRARERNLRGISDIRSIINELNNLHPRQESKQEARRLCGRLRLTMADGTLRELLVDDEEQVASGFGAWGFLMFVDGKSVYERLNQSDEWFKVGAPMNDLVTRFARSEELAGTVVVAIRMPLVTHLALSERGTEVEGRVMCQMKP